jgi:low molecular weight protein-tyrosine phosphatase
MADRKLRILFVCSGNICRSPLAEAYFENLVGEAGVANRFDLDSAGTHDLHEGEPADPRARRVGERHGLSVTSIARPVVDADFDRFDLIVAMDRGHRRELRARAGRAREGKVRLMRDFDPDSTGEDVPDPYYDGEAAFEKVLGILAPACRGLLESLLP